MKNKNGNLNLIKKLVVLSGNDDLYFNTSVKEDIFYVDYNGVFHTLNFEAFTVKDFTREELDKIIIDMSKAVDSILKSRLNYAQKKLNEFNKIFE